MENLRSDNFYIRIYGSHALFTSPHSKGGGEKTTYSLPTRQALTGIVDACYWKPVLKNIVTEVKVINPIRTQVRGSRALLRTGKLDLNYISYLHQVEYLVKYHFEWNLEREDLKKDRNLIKHTEIAKRSLAKGGRRDIFLGTRECVGHVELINKNIYKETSSYYEGTDLSFGLMFHSFIYPSHPGEKLVSTFKEIIMRNGVIDFEEGEETLIKNHLSNYDFKYPEKQKSADEELEDYENSR